MDGPLSAVLLASGWIESTGDTSLKIREGGGPAIETEIGLILDEPVHDEIPDVAALKQNVRALVAVVELPASTKDWSLPTTIADIVAINVGSDRFIIGQPNKNLNLDLESLPIQLTHDGKVINDTTGGDANRGQWWNFLHQINHAVRQGYSLEAGHLIITGALGKINNTGPGDYIAGFGDLGTIRFTLKSP
jgi:2-keto-4-pentenoate hydratase